MTDVAPAGASAARFSARGLPKWSAAVRRAQSGLGRAKIVCLGDSTTAGYGSPGRSGSWCRQLAEQMGWRGARETGLFSDAGLGATYDSRMVRGAGWAADTTKGLGGGFYRNLTLTANPMTFTPQLPFEAVDLFLYGTTSLRVTIGAGTPVVVTGAFGAAVGKRTVTCAQAGLGRGAHAVSLVALNTSGHVGLDCYDAGTGISVMNAGVSGWKAADFVLATYGVADTLDVLEPDLVIYNVGINDWGVPTGETPWKGSVQTVIERAVAVGADVLLCVPINTGNGNRPAFAQYLNDLATLNGLVQPLDLGLALGNLAQATAAGDMIDSLHPSTQGYGKIAALIRRRIA
ncbi:SGNH/GDSL hydrolase family protein [Brevundimonas bacteroides]|uniref:SGNH/GDSL hydrolase family protein n=1 Tax=Brevundimonas bacteroides TaxID=74311 RepID=UPI00138DFAE1|nr:SGNH/GDSL hydrolase family protein [Brevundimonas bacteroides]